MEYTTRFTLICKNTTDADALHAVFSGPEGAPLTVAVQAFFAARKLDIHPPDPMGFDAYERSGLVVDAGLTSGSTHVDDFIKPLSKVCHVLHAELMDDEVAHKLEYGFIDGKKKPPAEVIDLMKTLAPPEQLGRVGRIIQAAERMENDPTYAFIRAIGFKKSVATVQALLAKGADPNSVFSSGHSCLNRAVTSKSVKIVQLMLEHGANPNLPHKGYPNLYEACRFSAPKIVDLLLQYGANPDEREKGSSELSYPIEIAIYYHLSKSVQSLLAKGAKTTGMPKMGNLLELNARYFHDNHSGHLDEKLEIFKLLTQDPVHQADLVNKRDHLVSLLKEGFDTIGKTPKDHKDFGDILAYMDAVHRSA